MNTSKVLGRIVPVLALCAVTAATPGFGQQKQLRVPIPFAFEAGGKKLPSGTYRFVRAERSGEITLSDAAGVAQVKLLTITLLARGGPQDDHLLAFDKVGEERVLSEVWLPEVDGALVFATKGEHGHEIIRLNRGKK
jgi:hypothetical protein